MTLPGTSLRFDLVDHVLLVVHADMRPHPEDWERLLLVRDANRQKIRATLVIAPPHASLDSAQRSSVAQFTKATGGRIAVLTHSALVRGVARALGLLGLPVSAFSPPDILGALAFCGVPKSRHVDMLRRIEALEAHLSSAAPEGPAPPKQLSQ